MSVGWAFETVEEIGSTSDALIERARAGAKAQDRVALLARRQTRGRGRQGRSWDSEDGNLAVSLLLRPEVPAANMGWLVFVAGLALREALQGFVTDGRMLALKWPNDVMLGDGKLGGILVESGIEGGRVAWLVAGFGANLRQAPVLAGRRTACLGDCARDVPRPEAVARSLLTRWDRWAACLADGFDPVRVAWLRAAHPLGTRLVVDGVEGRFAGLAADGALRLQTPAGVRIVRGGEAVLSTPVGERAAGPHIVIDLVDTTSHD